MWRENELTKESNIDRDREELIAAGRIAAARGHTDDVAPIA